MSLKYWNGSAWVVVAGSQPGAQGPTGPTGPAGNSATIAIGTTTTLAAGQNASVTNSGTASAAVLNFSIPAGAAGAQGPQGVAGQRGSYAYTGIADPVIGTNPASPAALDTYLNTTTGNYFQYSSTPTPTWTLQGNLKGPTGSQGATGPTGPTGPSGSDLANSTYAAMQLYANDAQLNLGIWYPKYTSTLTQSQLTSKFAASSYLF
jgi:hypothetical protein